MLVVTREEVIGNLFPGSVISLLFSETSLLIFFTDFNDKFKRFHPA